jgi:putative DNA primase/helicase
VDGAKDYGAACVCSAQPNRDAASRVFPKDSVELAWEILGDLITSDRSIQKAICVVGEGGNGKSVFCQLCINFVGEQNVAHLSLQKLDNDRFAPARLYGKLANICTDLPGSRAEESATFKAITGCDRITGELKYRDTFEFRPFARLIFSANHFPATRYGSQSYFDRWLLIPFERRFRGSERDIPRSDLDNRISAAREMSGALNRALPAIRRLRKTNRFSETESVRRACQDFEVTSDPFRIWLEAETECTPSGFISQSALHAAHAQACLQANRAPITKQMFGRMIRKYRPETHEFQRTVDGNKQWMYGVIALRHSNHSMADEKRSD